MTAREVDLDDKRLAFATPADDPLVVVREVAMKAIFELAIVSPFVGACRAILLKRFRQQLELDLSSGRHRRHPLDDTV